MGYKMLKYALVLAASFAIVPDNGSAASLSFAGGTAGTVGTNFNLNRSSESVDLSGGVVVFSGPTGGSVGGGLILDRKASLDFTFVGKEAAARNRFFLGSADSALSNRGPLGSTLSGTFDVGSVDFGFDTILGGRTLSILNNGTSAFGGLAIAFSQIFNGGKSVYALFDDGRGDNDFDDMVVRIDITSDLSEVPLPAGGLLIGSALAGLALVRRRRKN